ncbi:chitosanase [Subtercola sp. Z020]|uniref:glycosyl hydrolase family 8 n=1 Tax=Subtercola sp. Z020 TaxID=2080582 RepID=UPI000CE8D151|nr:glycosyl hydrolase family 8 [Subtercola sp. Z020]PPF89752.1 chitosanase [Subtercola sp. Z020]
MFRRPQGRSTALTIAVVGALCLPLSGALPASATGMPAADAEIQTIIGADAPPTRPFGSHPVVRARGSALPPGDAAQADAATLAAYTAWKPRHLVAGCGAGRYYVDASSSTPSRVVSEGQGYGMVVVALMAGADPAAQAEFDGLFRFAADHPSEVDSGLMAWHQDDGCASIPGDAGSATDGDLDIAFGLLLADRQWGSTGTLDYRAEALKRIAAIKRSEINPTTHLTKLGDWPSRSDAAHWFATRSSDFMTDHFLAFQTATGDPFWGEVITATDALITTVRQRYAPDTGLLPDFIVSTNTTPKPAPAGFQEGEFDGAHS